MARIPRVACIPTTFRECLGDCVTAIQPQVDWVILRPSGKGYFGEGWDGFTATDPSEHVTRLPGDLGIFPPDMNISKWWNELLVAADRQVRSMFALPPHHWDIAVINDDVIVPEGWFDAVSTKMREHRCAAACSGGVDLMPVVHHHAGPVPLHQRMQGFAFMLAGEKKPRADERLKWWFGDDDLGWRAAAAGGMVMIPGFQVNHLHPNGQMTPELHAQTGADAQTFVDIWGKRPW